MGSLSTPIWQTEAVPWWSWVLIGLVLLFTLSLGLGLLFGRVYVFGDRGGSESK
jgi:hypothetical protein